MTRVAEHGSSGMYQSGCRCDACRQGNNERARAYTKRKRLGLPKSPAKAAAGAAGAVKRWGDHVPYVIYLHGLSDADRERVVQFVRSLRAVAPP